MGDVQAAAVDSFSALLESPEGAHTSIGEGRDRCQLLLLPGHHHDVPTAAVIPLDADMMGRVEALTRLWRAVEGRPAIPDTRITAQQRGRLRTMMLAADGRANGASYRDIALVLYGHKRVASEPWKTSALRDKVIGLVKGGLTMIGGGYLKLLRHRRRP
ncbi:DUF2285 domain-containing protein [Xanthobacter wiegelii]|uniref:DUF2285 domain-containing protein n=1 Tax=Xanthobacter wiegelii TaxID=3119913 RepID=UPI003727AABA